VAYPIEIGANSVAIASGYGSLHGLSLLARPERVGRLHHENPRPRIRAARCSAAPSKKSMG